MSEGVVKFTYHEYRGEWKAVEEDVIEEGFVSIFVNGQELATVMCSPREQDRLALGFLCNEGIITSLDDVRAVQVCPSGACVDNRPCSALHALGCSLAFSMGFAVMSPMHDLSEAVE